MRIPENIFWLISFLATLLFSRPETLQASRKSRLADSTSSWLACGRW